MYAFITNKNDFKKEPTGNVALFAAGVWVAHNLLDVDLLAPATPS